MKELLQQSTVSPNQKLEVGRNYIFKIIVFLYLIKTEMLATSELPHGNRAHISG